MKKEFNKNLETLNWNPENEMLNNLSKNSIERFTSRIESSEKKYIRNWG
jgi:hypothetical protein